MQGKKGAWGKAHGADAGKVDRSTRYIVAKLSPLDLHDDPADFGDHKNGLRPMLRMPHWPHEDHEMLGVRLCAKSSSQMVESALPKDIQAQKWSVD